MLDQRMKIALAIQYAHLALASLWNIYGVYLLSIGKPSPGPAASLSAVGIMAVFAVSFVWGLATQSGSTLPQP